MQLVSKISNLSDHNPPTSQTDGRTTCDRKTALCTKVHCAVKMSKKCLPGWGGGKGGGRSENGGKSAMVVGGIDVPDLDHPLKKNRSCATTNNYGICLPRAAKERNTSQSEQL